MKNNTISFIALGCRANQAENSEYHQGMLEVGWEVIDHDLNNSDVYVINTCTVTNEAERQSRQLIRKIIRKNPDSKIIVTGCSTKYLQANTEIASNIDLFIPNLDKDKFLNRLYNYLDIEKDFTPVDFIPHVEDSDTTRLNIKITDGCNWACSYCIIPRVRGKLRSISEDEIIARVKKAEEMGYKEVVLTGIQLGGYGKDFGKNGLELLIPRMLKETSIQRIRLSSIEPTDISDKLIEELSKSDRICNHMHIPVQSGADHILDLMKRRYYRAGFEDRINTLRKYIPNVTITTDILVGFPSETEEDFEDSCEFVQKIGFNKLHIFPYSDRQGTVASKMPDKIHPDIIKVRKKLLSDIDKKMQIDWLKTFLGKTKEVLVETTEKDKITVHSTAKDYSKVLFTSSSVKKNDIVNVLITEIDEERFCLKGDLIV